MERPEKEQLYLAIPALLVALVVGYSIGSTPTEEFDTSLDVNVNSSNPVGTASFDNRELTVMHQNDAEGKFFMDVTGDGSADREIDIIRDGSVHQITEIVTLDGKTYFVYFRYSDDPEKTGDSWLKIYRATVA